MPATLRKNSNDTLMAELGQLSTEPARRKFLAQHKKLIRQEIVEQLSQLVVQKVRVSTQEALCLAETAMLIAKRLAQPVSPLPQSQFTNQPQHSGLSTHHCLAA